jgi:hypothetical protein
MNRAIETVFLRLLREDSDREEVNRRIRYLKDSDWQALSDFSVASGLLPLFYTRLTSLRLENIPPGFLSCLKALYLVNLKKNILLEKELFKIISHFKENNIPLVPLKGPALARFLYDDLSLRQASCDLDLLVRKEQFEETEYALKKIGFAPTAEGEDASRRNFNLKYYRELGFVKDSNGLLVELHIDMRQLFTFAPLEDFWSNLKEVELEGNKILMPSGECLLVYLSLAAMSINEFVELRYLYDIHTLMSKFRKKLDLRELQSKLKDARYGAAVFFALRLSGGFFGTDIPADFLKEISPNGVKASFLNLWINKGNVLRRRKNAGYSWYYFFTAWHYFVSSYLYSKGVFDCIRIIYRKIFFPLEELAACYNLAPSKAAHFLYIKRVFKPVSNLLLRKYNKNKALRRIS